jgi:TonB family protein
MRMSDKKTCVRCERQIDRYARICPFCNWDQSETVAPRQKAPAQPAYVPPVENRWRSKAVGVGAFVALIVVAFFVGMVVHGWEPAEVKAAQAKSASTASVPPAHRSQVTLVPVTGGDMPESIEHPITSAPPQAPGQQPNDATALPAEQYAAAAARVKAQREAEKAKQKMVDPRSLTGAAYEPSDKPVRPPTPTQNRTDPVPEYQPVPEIHVDRDITARLNLTVGPDGRVSDIAVNQTIPEMQKLISAVQNWRFKPATENGNPVASKFSVEITFHGNE